MSRRARVAGGFTLVELLVALVIVGMIAAVAVPALRSRGGAAAAAKDLATVYAVAREAAISRGAPATAEIELSSGSYRVVMDGRPGRAADTVRAGTLRLPADARLSSRSARGGRARMSFDALGRAHGDDVVLGDANGRYEILADPWTGTARVQAR